MSVRLKYCLHCRKRIKSDRKNKLFCSKSCKEKNKLMHNGYLYRERCKMIKKMKPEQLLRLVGYYDM